MKTFTSNICVTASLIFLFTFLLHSNIYALDVSLPSLQKAYECIHTSKAEHVNALLPNIKNDSPMLRVCETNGIAFGVPYFFLRSSVAEKHNDTVKALHYLRLSEACFDWCRIPTNSAREALYNKEKTSLTADICLGMTRNARSIDKNYTAETYAYRLLSLPDVAEDKEIAARLELVQLYATQGRYHDAYSVCTSLHARATILPKEAFVRKADAAFRVGKNREAFSDLLTVLYTDGLQVEKPEDDPALRLFLKRIGRADREDIFALYDALKTQLDYEELVQGKEKLIAFLIQERMLLAKIFPYLEEATDADLVALDARIHAEEKLRTARKAAYKKNEVEKNE